VGVKPFTILIPSFRPALAKEVEQSLSPLPVTHWDGTGYPSFAKLINDCIIHSPTERVVICSDKVRPTPDHIGRMMRLLDDGFAFVGLYYFACFGFPKQLVRQIGFFDERFVGGEFEDSDYMVRIREANLAYYLTKEVPYHPLASSWDNSLTRDHYLRKWGSIHINEARRRLPEESRPGNELGNAVPTEFLPASSSVEEA
jgi:hypothetical protein